MQRVSVRHRAIIDRELLERDPSLIDLPNVPVLSIPVPSFPAPSIQAPSIPVPSIPVPSIPVPSIPVPSIPVPSIPVPSIPVPSIPVPSIPVPSIPVPSIPAPSIPAPSIPAPSIPAPSIPAPSNPAPSIPAPSNPAPSIPAPSTSAPGGSNGGTSSAPGSSPATNSGGNEGSGSGWSGSDGSGNGNGGVSGGGGTGGGMGNGNGNGNENENGGSSGGSTTGSGSTETATPPPSQNALFSSPAPSPSTGTPSSASSGRPLFNANGQVIPDGGLVVLQSIQGTPTIPSLSSTGNPKASQSTGVALQSTGTYTGVGSSPSGTSVTAAEVSHQLSSATIAGIVLICLLFLGFIVVVVRRRSIVRRIERRERWWCKGTGSLTSIRDPQGGGASRASTRSSFATNFDQGFMLCVDPFTSLPNSDDAFETIPEFPPMAEVRERTSVLFPSAGVVAYRDSITSMTSNGSDTDAQYLVVLNNLDSPGASSPMSVRPFSPSESFALPKPPLCTKGEKMSTFGSNCYGHTSPMTSVSPLIQIHSPPPVFNSDLSSSTATIPYVQPNLGASLPSASANLDTSSNPFADPPKPESYDLETIRRPFTGTLDDELSISIGDEVHVTKVFDDGWALVEKYSGSLDRNESGLIPVDCLREAGQALPSFLAQKLASGYGADAGRLAEILEASLSSK